MLGIGVEFAVFIHAVLSGIVVTCVYLSLRVLRRIVPHALWAVNLEDMVYWLGTALYLFVQIYHTSDGVIRWYCALGIVLGACAIRFLLFLAQKIAKKMYVFILKKSGKSVAKSK